jgi:hypothetical protein
MQVLFVISFPLLLWPLDICLLRLVPSCPLLPPSPPAPSCPPPVPSPPAPSVAPSVSFQVLPGS